MSLPQASPSLPANHAGHGLLPATPKIPLRGAAETTSAEAAASPAAGLLPGLPGLNGLPVRCEATRNITGTSPESSTAGLIIPGLRDPPLRRDAQGDPGLGSLDSLPINNLGKKADPGSMQGVSVSSVPALPLRREASANALSKIATSSAAGLFPGLPGLGMLGGLKRDASKTLSSVAATRSAAGTLGGISGTDSFPGLDSLDKLENLRREAGSTSADAVTTTSAHDMVPGPPDLGNVLGGDGLKCDVVPTVLSSVHTLDAAVMQSLQNSNRVAATGDPAHEQHNRHSHPHRAVATSSRSAGGMGALLTGL